MTPQFTEDDIICTDKYLSLAVHSNVTYLKTDILYRGTLQWRGEQHSIKPSPIWISGHSDLGITPEIWSNHQHNCQTWFTVNKQVSKDNLFALPLGITNDCDDSPIHRIYGNKRVMVEVAKEDIQQDSLLYMNFSQGTHPSRSKVYSLFVDKQWVTKTPLTTTLEGRTDYLRDLRRHRFVLCPRGNGVDTHRLWETLYMGSIPVVERDVALEEFTDLPICWVDRWETVTPEFLEAEYARIRGEQWNWNKLRFSYWEKRILANPRLGTVVTATDLNPLYMDFIPVFIKAWKTLLPEVDVRVVLIADAIPANLQEYAPYLALSPPIPGLHTAFQAQAIRLLYPRHVERTEEAVLITDMDMLPLSRRYYTEPLTRVTPDTFVVYRDECMPHQISMCYVAALPRVWTLMFGETPTETLLREWYLSTGYTGVPGESGWFTDQQRLIQYFNAWTGPKRVFNDRETGFRRLDRSIGLLPRTPEFKAKIATGYYTDYHSLRPYGRYKETIDWVIDALRPPKVLVLILASDTHPDYVGFQESWRSLIQRAPSNFEFYFYKADPALTVDYRLEGDTLTIKMEESLATIHRKTYKAFSYFAARLIEFDYVLRPNLSSFFVLDRYLAQLRAAPLKGYCSAVIGNYKGIPFPSGSGFTLSTDVLARILTLESYRDSPENDDVAIGAALRELGGRIVAVPRMDVLNGVPPSTNNHYFHFRIKSANRLRDIDIHRELGATV